MIHNNNQKIPEFLLKLRNLVDSPITDKLIYWNQDGKTFSITDGHQLAKEFFPLIFKHKNIFSFIRQLNMYGFHKINRVELNVQTTKSYDDSEWFNPNFIHGRPELLFKIQRKNNLDMDSVIIDNKNDNANYEINALKSAFRHLKQRDEVKSTKITDLEVQNKRIREELSYFRVQMDNQSRWINEITNSFSNFTTHPDALKSAICFSRPLKRHMLALTSPSFKHIVDDDSSRSPDESGSRLPIIKVEKVTYFSKHDQEVDTTQDISITGDDIYNPLYFEEDSSCRTTRDYEVDELLNDS